jgi:hypothetical protein
VFTRAKKELAFHGNIERHGKPAAMLVPVEK